MENIKIFDILFFKYVYVMSDYKIAITVITAWLIFF